MGSNEARTAYRDTLVAYLEQHKELLDEDSQRRLYSNPLRVLDSKNPAMADMLAAAPQLLDHLDEKHELRLRVLPDILTGASAGGINAVFLAQAIHSGQSLEPLTDLWLDNADVDRLIADNYER